MPLDGKNSGALFRKEKQNDRQPDYTGFLDIDGRRGRVVGWIRRSKAGQSYMSLLMEWEDQREQPAQYRQPRPRGYPPGNPRDQYPPDSVAAELNDICRAPADRKSVV